LTSLSRFSGVNSVVDTSYVYDNNQRLIKLAHKKGASTVASYDYGYDNADKLAATVSSVDGTSNYSYDSTNQLTGASHSSQTNEAYSYDANGNRTSGGTVTGVNNQLLNDGTYSYQYDGEGNRTKRVEIATGKVTEYVWDYRNRLTSVLFKDAAGVVTKTIEYVYDGNNQRIGKRIDGAVTERYVIDRNQISLVFDGTGSQTHRYLYGTGVDAVLADESGSSTNWMLGDNQGSIRDVVDGNGNLIDHVVYDSFGKVQSQSNTAYDLRYGYAGREQDAETGLDYYRARYYDAGNGRFISEDPLGFEAGDGNLTRYVGNNAVNATDPTGYFVSIQGVATRKISYRDRRGSYNQTNDIQQVINASTSDRFIRIILDETQATLVHSDSPSGTRTNGSAIPPGFIPGKDNAGHIIANQLGGSGTDINNLFAQTQNGYNQRRVMPNVISSEWRNFEDMVRANMEAQYPDPSADPCIPRFDHPTAQIKINLQYEPNGTASLRPTGVKGVARYRSPFGNRIKIPSTSVFAPNP
jgi:RHS repeat-associated protein